MLLDCAGLCFVEFIRRSTRPFPSTCQNHSLEHMNSFISSAFHTLICSGFFVIDSQVFFGSCKQDPRQNPSIKLLSQVVSMACSTGGL